jgi:hypothetical protein
MHPELGSFWTGQGTLGLGFELQGGEDPEILSSGYNK